MTWQNQNDWSQWEYSLGDFNGTIKMTFTNQPGQWDIRGGGTVITAKAKWANDWREWRITDNSTTLTFKTKWGNSFDKWVLRDTDHGSFEVSTLWNGDPREWEIIDELDEDISLPMKMAMLFVVIYHSSPH